MYNNISENYYIYNSKPNEPTNFDSLYNIGISPGNGMCVKPCTNCKIKNKKGCNWCSKYFGQDYWWDDEHNKCKNIGSSPPDLKHTVAGYDKKSHTIFTCDNPSKVVSYARGAKPCFTKTHFNPHFEPNYTIHQSKSMNHVRNNRNKYNN